MAETEIKRSRKKWSDLLSQAVGIEAHAESCRQYYGPDSYAAKRALVIARRLREKAELFRPISEGEDE